VLFVSCLVALLFGPVVVALDGAEDAGALLAYFVILMVLVPVTVWLLHGAFSSGRTWRLVALAGMYGLLSYLYFQGLDDPSWKSPDPKADAFAAISGTLHLVVVICCFTVLLVSRGRRRARDTADRHP
jgi:hypothetical protein